MKSSVLSLLLVIFCGVCFFSCGGRNEVYLYKVEPDGSILDVGRGYTTGRESSGCFVDTVLIERAWIVEPQYTGTGFGEVSKVCHVNFEKSQSLRLEPCEKAYLLNEGRLDDSGYDFLGVYVRGIEDDWGIYRLYRYVGGGLREFLKVRIHGTDWDSHINVVQAAHHKPGVIIVSESVLSEEGRLEIVRREFDLKEGLR